nr:hypothetical protein [Tanacetum cinerariifolium]
RIVQQWNPKIGMQKAEHSRLPVWVRMTDVPLEAWSIDGISALASCLGMPLIMDTMTASMCHNVTRQSVFCHIDGFQGSVKFFCSIVYASNSKEERNMLLKEIYHSHALLIVPSSWKKKAKSFRFANYIADKPGFLKEVEEGWKKNGDLTVRVEMTRVKLQEAQTLVEKNPHDCSMKDEAVKALCDYNEAVKDEEKLLAQKARLKWLNEGDRNSSYFHKVIKGRRSRNRVDMICPQ